MRRWLVPLVTLGAPLLLVGGAVAAPTASFTYQPSSPSPGDQVTFTSTSTSSGPAIVDYEWDLDGDNVFGEAGEPSGPSSDTAQRSFPAAGDYTVSLRVTDSTGAENTSSQVVPVRDAPLVSVDLLSPDEGEIGYTGSTLIYGRVSSYRRLRDVVATLTPPGGGPSKALRLNHYCGDCDPRTDSGVGFRDFQFGPINALVANPGHYQIEVTATDVAGVVGKAFAGFDAADQAAQQIAERQNIFVTGIEVTQGIQHAGSLVTRPEDRAAQPLPKVSYRGVPLIRGKRTVVRVWAGLNHSLPDKVGGVPAVLHGYGPDGEFEDSPIQANKPTLTIQKGGVEQVDSQRQGSQDPEVKYKGEKFTYNFELPTDWTSPFGIRLKARVNRVEASKSSTTGDPVPECDGCRDHANDIEIKIPHFYYTTQKSLRIYPWRPIYQQGAFSAPGMAAPGTYLAYWGDYTSPFMDSVRKLFPIAPDDVIVKGIQGEYLAGTTGLYGDEDGNIYIAEAEWAKDELPFSIDYPQVTFAMLPRIGLDRPGTSEGDIAVAQLGGVNYDPSIPGWTNPAVARFSPAHEVAHVLGFSHASCAHGEDEGGSCDEDFPHPHGGIGGYGFDIENMKAIRPSCCGSDPLFGFPLYHRHDFMSYGSDRWISVTNYVGMFLRLGGRLSQVLEAFGGLGRESTWRSLPAAREGSARGSQVAKKPARTRYGITGVIESDGSARLGPLVERVTRRGDELGFSGSYSMVLRGAGGEVLHTRDFEPQGLQDGDGSSHFSLVLPRLANAQAIELRHGGQLLASRARSAHKPKVRLRTQPRRLRRKGSVTLKWSSRDADGDALSHEIQFSRDGGRHWRVVVGGIQGNAFPVALDLLQGTEKGRFRIVASDGFNVGDDTSNRLFVVPNRRPAPDIYSPAQGAAYLAVAEPAFQGFAFDPEDGRLPARRLRWLSNRDGLIGVGPDVTFRSPSIGRHKITLQATDRRGRRAVARTSVVVNPNLVAFPGLSVAGLDRKRPKARVKSPRPGGHLKRRARIRIRFSETVTGINKRSIRLVSAAGRAIPTRIVHSRGGRRATLVVAQGLRRGQTVKLRISKLTDLQGNRVHRLHGKFET